MGLGQRLRPAKRRLIAMMPVPEVSMTFGTGAYETGNFKSFRSDFF